MKEYDCDVLPEYLGGFGSVTTSAIVRLFQRAATRHSDELGYTSDWLTDNNSAWVAREHHLERLGPFPKTGTVTVRTTVEDMRRVRSLRSYEIVDPDSGNELVRGTTEWVHVDRENGRPRRIPTEMKEGFDPTTGGESPRRRKLDVPDLSDPDGEFTYDLQFRDLDEMGHVNNVVYVEYLFEALLRTILEESGTDPSELLERNLTMDRLSVRYLDQTRWDSPLVCAITVSKSGGTNGEFAFELRQDGTPTTEGRGHLSQ